MNQTLEQRVAERTAELRAREAQFRTLVEHAPEAIVVFDGMTGRFEEVNENAMRLYRRSREELLRLTHRGCQSSCVSRMAGHLPKWRMRNCRPLSPARCRCSSGCIVTPAAGSLPAKCGWCICRANAAAWCAPASLTTRSARGASKCSRATYEISEAVHAVEDLASLYERIHRIVGGLMPAKDFYLALFDPATETISFPYFVDESEASPRPFRLGTGLTSYVLRTGKPLLMGAEMNARKRRVGDEVTFEGHPELALHRERDARGHLAGRALERRRPHLWRDGRAGCIMTNGLTAKRRNRF